MARFAIRDFMLANSAYIGAVVHFYGVDVNGVIDLDNLITLYEGLTGSDTLPNPQKLDGDGKFVVPAYADESCIGRVSGLAVDDHDTGIISANVGTPSYAGAVVRPSADVVNPAYPYVVIHATVIANPLAVWSAGSPTKLTTPAGYSKVRLKTRASWLNIAADSGVQLTIYKNGSAVYDGVGKALSGKCVYTNPTLECSTPWLDAVQGDEWTMVIDSTDASSNLDASDSWFEMELQ